MDFNEFRILVLFLLVGVLFAMVLTHSRFIVKQGQQIKQLEAALQVYTGDNK